MGGVVLYSVRQRDKRASREANQCPRLGIEYGSCSEYVLCANRKTIAAESEEC